jgi:hypothetical protein
VAPSGDLREAGNTDEAGKKTDAIISQMKDTAEGELPVYVGISKIDLSLNDPTLPVGCIEIQDF